MLQRETILLRLPESLKEAITVQAGASMRSFNAEVITRLYATLGEGVDERAGRTKRAGVDERAGRTKRNPRSRRAGRTKRAARARRAGRTKRKPVK